MKKISLIVPPNTIPKDSIRRLAAPLGMLYLAANLEKEGHDVDVFDCTCEGYYNTTVNGDYITYGSSDEEIKDYVRRVKPDVVGINCLFLGREYQAFKTARLVKEVDENIKVVFGGVHPSTYPERMLSQPFIDFVILREGEFRIVNLVNSLEEGKNPDVEGICFKDNGKITISPATTRIENLDEIPFPARHLVDFEKYIKISVPYAPFSKKKRVAQLLTSRGCPFHCNFCSTQVYWGGFRTRSVDNIMEEIDELVTKYKIEEIQFLDDNMTVDKNRAKELFKRMRKYDLSWCTPHGLAIITLDEEMIRLMAESGAYQISIGVESGSQEVLDNIIHKNLKLSMVKPVVDAAHNHGISVHGLFVVGLPGETREQIMQTFDFPKKIGFESVSFFTATPLPGSDLWEECLEKGYLSDDYKNLNFETIDFKKTKIIIPKDSKDYSFSPEELVKLIEEKMKEYNEWSRKRWPDRWDAKFKTFLERHPNDSDLIMGRVT